MNKYTVKILDIKEQAGGTKSYYLQKPADFFWQEGAHTHIALPGFDAGDAPRKEWVRHMSIMTLPEEGSIGFTTRVPGSESEFKNRLNALHPGDMLIFFKLGSKLALQRLGRPIVLLTMGVGIAAARPVVLAYARDGQEIPCLTCVNVDAPGAHLFRNELDSVGTQGYTSLWPDSRNAFYQMLPTLCAQPHALYYIVGSDAFIHDVIAKLRSAGVADADILLDKKDAVLHNYFGA